MINEVELQLESGLPIIIAETAFSHEGSVDYLIKLIESIRGQERIYIKLQVLINKDEFLTNNNPIYSKIDRWILSETEWCHVIDYAYEQGVKVIIAALDKAAIKIAENKVEKIHGLEIHPSCVPDHVFFRCCVEFCNRYKLLLVLGISGFEIDEIDYLYQKHLMEFDNERLVFMYGFQNYPTKLSAVNLLRINLYKEKFGVRVGYADHTEYDDEMKDYMVSLAYGMGINLMEVHLVLEYGVDRIDYIAAYDAARTIALLQKLDVLNVGLGEEREALCNEEMVYSTKFRKVPVYKSNMMKGHLLSVGDIIYKRADIKSEYKLYEVESLIDKKLLNDVFENQPIVKEDLE